MQDVSDRKQLFIDHRYIDSQENVHLQVNPPAKLPGQIINSDKPWDAFNIIYFSIAEDEGLYKMWYQAYDNDQWNGGRPRLCYATSHDGVTWEKPDLGLVEFQGSKKNNIILEPSKLAYVFIDPHGKKSERFKMITTGFDGVKPLAGARVGTSADGLQWHIATENSSNIPWDTQKVAFWDDRIGRYVVYLKLHVGEDGTPAYPMVEPIASDPPVVAPKQMRPNRSLGRLELDELKGPWPDNETRTVLTADEEDPPDSDIYHHLVYPYPFAQDAYFMFPFTYQHFQPDETTVTNDGVNDIQFCASRDGIHWMRYGRQPYIRRGLPGEPDCGLVHATPFVIRKGNYLYHYFGGSPWTHGGFRRLTQEQRDDRANWGRAYHGVSIQRLDGFVSADTGSGGGWLVTPPMNFSGSHLELNIDVSAMGETRVEIQDERGLPVAGHTLSDCDRVLFNHVAHVVKWRGNSDLSGLSGRPVRLKIVTQSTKLYAFQFAHAR